MSVRIPLSRPEIIETDIDAVVGVLRTPYLSMGPKLGEFESAMCDYLKAPHAVAVNSGTSALHLALRALNLESGAEVILPSFAFGALLNVVCEERLKPVFVEIDRQTLNATPETIQAAVTPKTQVIIAVHTFGRPTEIDVIRGFADKKGIYLIEDACEALGAEFKGTKAGTLGHVGVLAFYPNKQITTGEGGMFITSDQKLAERARLMRNQGRDMSLNWYQHTAVGYSYRISDISCALGIEQLRRIEDIVSRRKQLAAMYDRKLAHMPDVIRPPLEMADGRISWFSYVVQLSRSFGLQGRDQVFQSLMKKGIGAGRYFAPLDRQPILGSRAKPSLPVTQDVANRVLALPFFNQMTEVEVEEVSDALRESLAEFRGRST